MTPSEYEQLVADIVAGICAGAPELDGFHVSSGRKNRLSGASGYKHQIDVSLIGQENVYLIECKRWETKIGVQEIMVLAARATDIARAQQDTTVHPILASKIGGTRGAITLAAYFGIQLEVVRSAGAFGFRIGKNVRAGVAEHLVFGDRVTATITK